MTNLTVLSNPAVLTMSSREIAELTGKEHKNVLADIRKMFTELKIQPSEFAGTYLDPTGRALPCYNLPKRETTILTSGYSVVLRARIVDRWMELEAEASNPQPQPTYVIPKTYSEALLLAAKQAEELERMRGPAEIGTAIMGQKNKSVVDVSKKLTGVNANKVRAALEENGYLRFDAKKGGYYPVSTYRDTAFCWKSTRQGSRTVSVITLAPEGYKILANLYVTGRLPMKAKFKDAWRSYSFSEALAAVSA